MRVKRLGAGTASKRKTPSLEWISGVHGLRLRIPPRIKESRAGGAVSQRSLNVLQPCVNKAKRVGRTACQFYQEPVSLVV